MKPRERVLLLLSALFALISITLAASPTSFCKCTCFGDSTIIPLDGKDEGGKGTSHHRGLIFRADEHTPPAKKTCNDCNRQFCLSYTLPICKGAKESDVFTTCFQRDSRKDEAVVFLFIFATMALLIYAAVKPVLERWLSVMRERRAYLPISAEGGG